MQVRPWSTALFVELAASWSPKCASLRVANQWDDFFWLPRRQANNPSPAAFAQGGLVSTRSGHNWLIEHNVMRHAKTIGIDIGDEGGADPEGNQAMPWVLGNHTVRWNRIVDNGEQSNLYVARGR